MNRACDPAANAFPLPTASDVINDGLDGLSKREYFAIHALCGWCGAIRDGNGKNKVAAAVELADLLIVELNK